MSDVPIFCRKTEMPDPAAASFCCTAEISQNQIGTAGSELFCAGDMASQLAQVPSNFSSYSSSEISFNGHTSVCFWNFRWLWWFTFSVTLSLQNMKSNHQSRNHIILYKMETLRKIFCILYNHEMDKYASCILHYYSRKRKNVIFITMEWINMASQACNMSLVSTFHHHAYK